MASITLNGAPYRCRAPNQRISDLIRDLALEGKRIAIERNGEIVPRSRHFETVLVDGDKIEVVAAVGGGLADSPHERPPIDTPALAQNDDPLVIAGPRLCVAAPGRDGGSTRTLSRTRAAIDASGAEIVTVAIRRTNIGQNAGEPSLLDHLPPSQFTLLPNTAGCYSADEAVRTLKLARELLDGHKLVKLEVLGDPQTLFPNVRETIRARGNPDQGWFRCDGCTRPTTRSLHASSRAVRLRRHHAACLADRFGHGHSQSVESQAHHRAVDSTGAGRRRSGHGIGRIGGDGARLRRCADEYRDSHGARARANGRCP